MTQKQKKTLVGIGLVPSSTLPAPDRVLNVGPDGMTQMLSSATGSPVERRIISPDRAEEIRGAVDRLALLHHPCCRRVLHATTTEEGLVLDLEPAPGTSLSSRLLEGPLTQQEAQAILQNLAGLLSAAHRIGLSHGALHPQTVGLLGAIPRIELTGARTLPPPDDAFAASYLREDEPADARDVRCLAALFLTLVGAEPQTADPNDCLPGDFVPLVRRMLREDPDARPSAAEVALALAEHPQARPTLLDETPPAQSPHQQLLGTVLGRFLLEDVIGEGAMGTVYRGVDRATGEKVAIKVLKEWGPRDETLRHRFRREARILARVKSPYVANLIDASMDEEISYLALEYVDGVDLETFLREREAHLDESQALQIVGDVCRALVEPHRHGIVHRDLKPENILVVSDEGGRVHVKLLDFGIAHTAPQHIGETTLTQAGALLGTPHYMSPEQCAGGEIGPPADVYALAATLFELLAGRPPFEGQEVGALMAAHVSQTPPLLSDLANVSEATTQIARKALSKLPEERYQNAAELLEAIERSLRGEPVALAQHNHIPAATTSYTYELSWDLVSSPQELWPHVSNTERMNEAVGLPPVSVDRIVEQDGTERTFLENSVLGQRLRWEEFPFEWVEGKRWGLVRIFEQGILRWYTVELELSKLPQGGTRLIYRMRFEPFSMLGRFIVFLEMGLKQRRSLGQLFRRIDAACLMKTSTRDPFVPAKRLPSIATRRIRARLAELLSEGCDQDILFSIERFLREAPDQEAARLRPLAFARKHDLDPNQTVLALLLAVRAGLFEMLWDVVCPLCRIPSDLFTSLSNMKDHGECPACKLNYPLDLAKNVEMVLQASSAVRSVDAQSYCIGGPAHSPHVAAQVRLAPGERLVLSLQLEPGIHQIRCTNLPGTVALRVSDETRRVSEEIVIDRSFTSRTTFSKKGDDPRLSPQNTDASLHMTAGEQRLVLTNALEQELVVRVERTADRADALTVAQALAIPQFRELFPEESLDRSRFLSVSRATFLAVHLAPEDAIQEEDAIRATVRLTETVIERVEAHGGAVTRIDENAAIAIFHGTDRCLEAAMDLLSQHDAKCSVGVHAGSVTAANINGRTEYLGKTVTLARTLAAEAESGTVTFSRSLFEDADVLQFLNEEGAPLQVVSLDQTAPGLWGVQVRKADLPPAAPHDHFRDAEDSLAISAE